MSVGSASARSGLLYSQLNARHSMVAAPPSAAQINRALKRRTGYGTTQVTSQDVCPHPSAAGRAQCAAQVLVTRSGHRRIHPSVGPRQRPEQTGSARPAAGLPVTPAAGQAAPSPYTPGYLQQAYDLSWLSANRGAGDTVAIVDVGYDADAASDLAAFRTANGLSSCPSTGPDPCFSEVNQSGSTDVSQMPATLAAFDPWHQETTLDIDAVSSICPNCNILLVEANGAWSSDLAAAGQTAATLGADQISDSFTVASTTSPGDQYTFPGVLTVAAAGDYGYTGDSNNYPAALPDVLAVGGTTLAAPAVSAGRGFGESAWSQVGVYLNPAATGSGCDTYEPKPTYQSDVGCAGRAGNDISADADPLTGLEISNVGQWELYGGTSLSAPLTAAYAALIGQHADSPAWTYTDASELFDPSTGNNEDGNSCTLQTLSYICNAGVGYDGPTGNGSISGTVVPGAPGLGGSIGTASVSDTSAALLAGVFPNGLATSYYWQYGPTTSYGSQTATTDIGSGQGVVGVADTLPGLSPSSTYHVRLVATNADGTVYGYDHVIGTLAGGVVDVPAGGVPEISGPTVSGHTLTADPGDWLPAPGSYTYQWQRSADGSTFTDVAGQTGPAYQLSAADLGDYLRVKVIATDTAGQSAPATSAPTGQVTTLVPWSAAVPTISGTAVNGQTLTTSTGAWNPAASDGYAYQWQRSADASTWTDITGATASSYTLQNADSGDTIRVQVTAFDSQGASQPASSAPTAVVVSDTQAPTVTGTAQRLDALTAHPGQWWLGPSAGTISYSYQWQRSGDGGAWANIGPAAGPSNTSYTPVQADEGEEIRVQVTATAGTVSATAASAATGAIAPNAPYMPVTPTIEGAGVIGQPLTISNATFAPSDVGPVSYQWQRSAGANLWTNIAGATASEYTPTAPDDIGTQIRVQLSASNEDGHPTISTSPVTVPARLPVNTSPPTITGTPTVGSVLSEISGTWENETSTAFVWQDCDPTCQTVASGGQLTLTEAMEGSTIQVVETATDDPEGGLLDPPTATASSDAFGPIAAPPVSAAPGTAPPPVANAPSTGATPANGSATAGTPATPPTTGTGTGVAPAPVTAAATATTTITKTGTKSVHAVAKQYASAKLTVVKHSRKRRLVITRAAGITGTMTAWACQTAGKRKCLAQRRLTSTASWTTTLTGTLQISVTLG